MINLYINNKRIASVESFSMAQAIAQYARSGARLITVREKGKVVGHFRYGHWEPKE